MNTTESKTKKAEFRKADHIYVREGGCGDGWDGDEPNPRQRNYASALIFGSSFLCQVMIMVFTEQEHRADKNQELGLMTVPTLLQRKCSNCKFPQIKGWQVSTF